MTDKNMTTKNSGKIETQSITDIVDLIFDNINKKISTQSNKKEDRLLFPNGIGHIDISIKQGKDDKLPDIKITISEHKQNKDNG